MSRYTPNVYRYTLAKNDQKTKCTGTCSKCTGTHHPEMPRMCLFSSFSCTFIHGSLLYFLHTKIIPNSPWNLFSIQFIFQFHIFLQTSFMNSSKIILIWVMTHIQTKYQDLLGFVLNPNSISFHLTMNPTTKGGFHTYLVPCGFLPTLISRNLRLGCNSIKTLDLETRY